MFMLYSDIDHGSQLDRSVPFWQPATMLHSVIFLILLWQINSVVVVRHCVFSTDTCTHRQVHVSQYHVLM